MSSSQALLREYAQRGTNPTIVTESGWRREVKYGEEEVQVLEIHIRPLAGPFVDSLRTRFVQDKHTQVLTLMREDLEGTDLISLTLYEDKYRLSRETNCVGETGALEKKVIEAEFEDTPSGKVTQRDISTRTLVVE